MCLRHAGSNSYSGVACANSDKLFAPIYVHNRRKQSCRRLVKSRRTIDWVTLFSANLNGPLRKRPKQNQDYFTNGTIIKSPIALKYPVFLNILRRVPNDEPFDGENSKDRINPDLMYERGRCIYKYIFELATR